ncbi:AAA family ATPase, partial [Rubripirellula amarantea]|nr:AAA family ATPase [Rubripirellula amarantea]
YAEAIGQFRLLLEASPGDVELQLALADAYYQDGKLSEAAVILESLIDKPHPPAAACVMYARLAMREGRVEDAEARYKQAIETDPAAADEELATRLGISPDDSYRGDEDEVFEGRVRQRGGEDEAQFDTELERPKVRFDDVGGMEELKEEIRVKIIYPLEHPDIYEAYGKSLGGGIMMYGPPGCGKTFLARATAGEINAGFLSIGINDVLDMWMGNSEKRLHQVFEHARENAPCVLFFDEVDALGGKRSDMHSGTARQLINQFLAELDGAEHSNDGVLVLAATNAPWHVDAAFRRPGRFDRVLFVPPPDEPARADILRLQCQGKPTRDIDYNQLAKKTPKFSGADMKAILDLAIEAKLTESIRKGGPPQPITGKDLLSAVKSHRPTTQEWFSSARNYALYANQGGLYDDVLKWLDK